MKKKLFDLALALAVSVLILARCGTAPLSPAPLPTSGTQEQGKTPIPVEPTAVPTPTSAELSVEPADASGARDLVLAYLVKTLDDKAPPANLNWTADRTTPQGLVGAETFEYTADGWVVTVSYPVVAPQSVVFQLVVDNQATGFRWEGEVDAAGKVTERTAAQRQATAVPSTGPLDQAGLVSGNNAFAFDLYRALRAGQEDKKGNLFYSPYSLSQALAMTYGGARAETEKQMAQALHFPVPQDSLHPAFHALDRELAKRGEGAQAKDGKGFRLSIVNALWGQTGYPFLVEFTDLLANNYGAGLRLVDFVGAAEDARVTINQWVSDKTEGRIKDLIPPGILNAMTRLVLTNAIYFNAAWAMPFNPDLTQDRPFYRLDGTQASVPMMRESESLGYAEGEGYQAIELPYDGWQMSMVILLPRTGKFDAFEGSLDSGRVDAILKGFSPQQVALTMPKFEFSSEFSLNQVLSQMGMPLAFTPDADFSGMTGKAELFISEVLHKAFISVDEAGTEAVAATAVVVGVTGMPAQSAEVTVDRPFMFLIRDRQTGTILFIGRIVDPDA